MRNTLIASGLFAAFTLAANAVPAPRQDFAADLAAADGWIAWRVAMQEPARVTCCHSGWRKGMPPRQGCTLDDDGVREGSFGSFDGQGQLPRADRLVVYARTRAGTVDKVFAVGDTCPVDERVPVRWTEASTARSVALLAEVARTRPDGERATYALAQHAGAEATRALTSLVDEARDDDTREQAVFWLGHARGAEGLAAAARIAREHRDDDLRSRAAFAISQSREPARLATLEAVLAAERDGEVRREGWFAISQTRDTRARAVLERALGSERDEDGMRGLVFALSQLPDGQGVDALLALARQRDAAPRLRREALFWLAQADDPRALAVLVEVLSR